jgi:hypothetical membrane protein
MDARHRRLSLLALLGTLAFLGCLLALHVLNITRAPPSHMSDYARTRYGPLFVAGAYAFLLAVISVILCLRRTLPRHRSSTYGVGLLLLGVPFGFLVATFPVDRTGVDTMAGEIHQWSVMPLFFFVTAAMLVLVPGLRAHPRWRPLSNFSLATGLVAALAQTAYLLSEMDHYRPFVGVAQRLIVLAILSWFLGVAVVLRRWPAEMVGQAPAPVEVVAAEPAPVPEPKQP